MELLTFWRLFLLDEGFLNFGIFETVIILSESRLILVGFENINSYWWADHHFFRRNLAWWTFSGLFRSTKVVFHRIKVFIWSDHFLVVNGRSEIWQLATMSMAADAGTSWRYGGQLLLDLILLIRRLV